MGMLKLSTASGGSVTLDPANTASNFTLTVPATTGTVLTNKTAGTVLQVVNSFYNTYVSTTSTSLTDTGLTATITPTSSTSKILVLVSLNSFNASSLVAYTFTLADGSNNQIISLLENQLAGSSGYGGGSISYLHSPATASAFTYKVRYKANSSGTVYLNNYNNVNGATGSSITLVEIAQ